MSTATSGDVSFIKDEDLLRKMWQDTEDFGRKKEIRAHMYKLREARLRDFYNSGEESSDIRTTTTTTEKHSSPALIMEQSKEIRNSPPKDVNFNITDKSWNVVSSNQKSEDGKTFTTSKLATTSGSELIQGGKIDYAAKSEHQASVYQDGDSNNFTKAVGASANTIIKQEASGGDENSSFRSSSTKTSSSSKFVSESKSSTSDMVDNKASRMITQKQGDECLVSKQTYTDNIPAKLKDHPSFVEGKTKVTRETKTLPDGTTVTTTRYETKDGSTTQASKTSKFSTTQQSSSVNQQKSSFEAKESRTSQSKSSYSTAEPTSITYQVHDRELQPAATKTLAKISRDQQSFDTVDNIAVSKSLAQKGATDTSLTTSKTTVVKNFADTKKEARRSEDFTSTTQGIVVKGVSDSTKQHAVDDVNTSAVVKTVCEIREQPQSVTQTSLSKQSSELRDERRQIEDSSARTSRHEDTQRFITSEKIDTDTKMLPQTVPKEKTPQPKSVSPERRPKPEPYEMPEKRQPIKPHKSELDTKTQPTEGQYDTTYRTDYTNKRISVDLSPTHEAFARSLRAVSPDRFSKCSSPSRGSLRNSSHSLRSGSTSPEKNRHPSRWSPERRSTSPKKTFSSETITRQSRVSTDMLARRNESTEIDSSTLTRRKAKTRSRSPSPTTTASDIEFIRSSSIVTDLDTNETVITTQTRPSSLEITRKSTRKITGRSPTSPLTSPKKSPDSKDITRRSSLRQISPTKETKTDRTYKRTDTYEERCRQILGITSESNRRKSSLDRITTSRRSSSTPEKSSPTKTWPRKSPEKKVQPEVRRSPEKVPTRVSPQKEYSPKISEFPSQTRRSPEKQSSPKYPEKGKPVKEAPKIGEFPAQIRRSPQKEPLGEYPSKKSPTKEVPTICEFPSQIRRSPEKQQLNKFPEKTKPFDKSPQIGEFPSQIRKSPQKEILGEYPTKSSPVKEAPTICEFPSQIRRSPEREPLEQFPEKQKPAKEAPTISEFPSQIRKSPERERSRTQSPVCRISDLPDKKDEPKHQISEFPSQIRRSPEKEQLGQYPDRKSPVKEAPQLSEFPSQIRRSPEKEPLGKYPERKSPAKDAPQLSEFPSQIRKSPERPSAEKPSQKSKPTKVTPTISEFPSQVQKSPERETAKPRATSTSSSSTEEEQDIEEINTSIKLADLEGRIPVNEPLCTKKFISLLVKDEEAQRGDLTKKQSQNVLDKEILDSGKVTSNKTVKKGASRKVDRTFIEKEKDSARHVNVNEKKYSPPRATSPVKKPLTDKNTIVATTKTISGTTKIDTKTTNKTITDKSKLKNVKKTNEKVTLWDIENLNRTKEDNRIHIRTHRIDDTLNKKNKILANGDVAKKPLTKRPSLLKSEEPTTKKTSERKIITKTSTETKNIINEQKTPRRHVVTTTITVSPKTRSSSSKSPTKSVTTKSTVTTKTTRVTKQPKLQNGHVSSDDESIVESLEGNLTEEITSIKHQKDKITRTTSEQTRKKIDNNKTTGRGPSKQDKKCITTKSIIINNEETGREVIVDLQRSKSSREQTPDRICPLPVTSDDGSTPRYPDNIAEPDDYDYKPKSKKISNVPIIEGEDLTEFSSITEIEDTTKINVNKVEENDESLLSVHKKINKFLDSNEKNQTPKGPRPKVERPKLEVTEDLESDECLLSVSQKVNKFVTTAEQLTAPQQDSTPRPKSPKCQYYPEDDISVSDKVAHFITTAENVVVAPKDSPKSKTTRPSSATVDEKLKEDECLLSVSDKVNKFINTSENISLSKMDVKKSSETTPNRRPSNQFRTEAPESKYPRRDSSPKLPDSTPRSTKRPSVDEPARSVLSPTGRLRSTESVRKAKALFENINKDQQVLKQRDILSRPSVFEGRRTETARRLEYDSKVDEKELKSTKLVMNKGRSRSKSPEKVPEVVRGRSQSPEGDIPGYMKPLDRSLRPNSPHRESISQINQTNKKYEVIKDEESADVRQTKFGVTLKRTDSGRDTGTSTTKTRVVVEGITETEIEQIYDLEILELLLEKVTDYELRRTIRTQIRLVRKLISEGRLEQVIAKQTRIAKEISSKLKEAVGISKKTTTEFRSYAYEERRSSSEYTKETRRSPSPKRSKSPEKTSRSTKVFETQLKRISPVRKTVVEDSKPEWAKQRNLRKHTESTISSRTSTTTTTKKSRTSPVKETKTTDIITSSYGVGPTDENGSPLFGLKALRSKKAADTTKVQGTVIRSQYYSENGQEPVGEVSVTKYSSDPKDLGRNEDKKKGITSITTTQKFGYKDTPSLKSITSPRKASESEADEDETNCTNFSRRGSVKVLSQKFIDNAVETSKSERQSSYPKAGLILRTSSFKESTSSGDSREGSSERTVTVKTSSSRTNSGDSFLTNRSKVTGVQDVISRMKSKDAREGDSIEDVEARGLLNKFIGSQVILSGFEGKSSTSSAKRTTKITTTIKEGGKPTTRTRVFEHPITDKVLQTVWDEQTLRLLLEQSTDYEERRKIRARLRQVMTEQEACTDLVERASQDQISTTFEGSTHTKETITEKPVTTSSQVTTRVTSTQQITKKPISPFAKFRQLDKQNSLNSPSTPKTPSGSGPLFKFTDPSLSQSASTIKDRLLHWCRMKTKEYENIQLDNFSTSWADGLAFCALIHHFLPDSFDYHALSPKNRRHNFTLAFQVADEKADIAPLLDVDDMVATRKPDWKCVFTYVQSIYRRFKDED